MSVIIVGGTAGIGKELARHYAARGQKVVITGRDSIRATDVAAEVGAATGLGFDLADPSGIADALSVVTGPVDHLVLAAIDRDANTAAKYDLSAASYLVTLKLIGYTEVVHALAERMSPDGSILLFGGMARVRPYPGSTTVTTVNAGVIGMVRTLSVELAPIRVNSIHPGIVGDSPFWKGKPAAVLEAFRAGTLTGRLASMDEVVSAAAFLLEHRSINGVDLVVDGGWR
ncbi:SDR family NAD(P)-dependent oxidoreductase [Allorhizocola rhizosphaerae]|uniref:SDR family NAD(P)-dependent oxidoreductase n=1 Tax=Allorhizocola rhizosphaerae TaxID=1872709 RepID=UPI000E3D270A|nr:SDR family oxidoreductase [Allorhizocola rhizosphaerae]